MRRTQSSVIVVDKCKVITVICYFFIAITLHLSMLNQIAMLSLQYHVQYYFLWLLHKIITNTYFSLIVVFFYSYFTAMWKISFETDKVLFCHFFSCPILWPVCLSLKSSPRCTSRLLLLSAGASQGSGQSSDKCLLSPALQRPDQAVRLLQWRHH